MRRKLFVSQPMRAKTKGAIQEERAVAVSAVEKFLGEEVDVINNISSDHAPRNVIKELGRSVSLMADADVVCFADGWKNARGCIVERGVAEMYGKPIIEIKENGDCAFWH